MAYHKYLKLHKEGKLIEAFPLYLSNALILDLKCEFLYINIDFSYISFNSKKTKIMIKKITCLCLFFFTILSVQAQDVLIKTNGDTINCEILLESADALLVKVKNRSIRPVEMQVLKAEISEFAYEEGIKGSMDSITEGSDIYAKAKLVESEAKTSRANLSEVNNTISNDMTGKRSFEVFFSPEYLSMSNFMYKVGDKTKFRIGLLYHQSTGRADAANSVIQFNVGPQFNRQINKKVIGYTFMDMVIMRNQYLNIQQLPFTNISTGEIIGYYDLTSIQTNPGIGFVLGGGFDVTVVDGFYIGVESGMLLYKERDTDPILFQMSNNSGIRFGIRF